MPKRQHILRLTLPIPPSINEQYATVNGLRVSTVVARRFKQQVRQKLVALEREGKLGETLRAHVRQDYLALWLAGAICARSLVPESPPLFYPFFLLGGVALHECLVGLSSNPRSRATDLLPLPHDPHPCVRSIALEC